MLDYSYLSASSNQQPAPHYELEGEVLLSGKLEVPLFWYALFAPHNIQYPKFENRKDSEFWYIEQPPYLITSKEKALSRLALRQKTLFKLLSTDQIRLYDQFSEVISNSKYNFLHMYTDPITRKYKFGTLKKKMLELLHCFEKLESSVSEVDLLFSPISYELGVDPKSLPFAWITPKFYIRRLQHRYWERKGAAIYDRETAPLRSERSFVPPTQYNLAGSAENISVPWQ